jgi:hypothetical protein
MQICELSFISNRISEVDLGIKSCRCLTGGRSRQEQAGAGRSRQEQAGVVLTAVLSLSFFFGLYLITQGCVIQSCGIWYLPNNSHGNRQAKAFTLSVTRTVNKCFLNTKPVHTLLRPHNRQSFFAFLSVVHREVLYCFDSSIICSIPLSSTCPAGSRLPGVSLANTAHPQVRP